MIYQKEIIQKAENWKIAPNTVDKDYVLGHFLHCFFSFQKNRDLFVFKGGTCLRKCYFPNYRFSEDLDFTLLDKTFIVDATWLKQITEICSQQSNIQFHLLKFIEKLFKDSKKGYQCVIAFWGANHNQNTPPPPIERWTTKIELDFCFDEKLVFPINYSTIHHPYSDGKSFDNTAIPIYSLDEIFVEKIRAFYQRSYKAPRDFYDVWYLLNHSIFKDWSEIKDALLIKCQLKRVAIDREIFNDLKIYKSIEKSWSRSIVHHLSTDNLVSFEEVWNYLKLHLFKIIFYQK